MLDLNFPDPVQVWRVGRGRWLNSQYHLESPISFCFVCEEARIPYTSPVPWQYCPNGPILMPLAFGVEFVARFSVRLLHTCALPDTHLDGIIRCSTERGE